MMTKPAQIVTLWDHQKKGVERAVEAGSFGFFFDPGTGKTLTTITTLRHMYTAQGKALKTLIFAPPIVLKNWHDEFDKFSTCGDLVCILSGARQQRIDRLTHAKDKSIFVTNYESLDMEDLFWCRKGKSKIPMDHAFEVLVLDESHRCKNPSAERTKLMMKLSDKIKHKFLLTGTPVLNTPMDLWPQFRIMDGGATFGKNFFAFRNEYFFDENAGKPAHVYWPAWKPRPGAQERITSLLSHKAMRAVKEDCLDLPPLVMQRIHVDMSRDQARHYESMRDDYLTFVRGKAVTASIALTKLLRLQQIVSGFLSPDGEDDGIPFKDIPRLKALSELLEDYAAKAPVIVWCSFRHNYTMIDDVCGKLGLARNFLTGNQSPKEKDQIVTDFRAGQYDVLIANPAAAGIGVNLVEAPVSIWYSRNFSLEHRLQGIARNYRGGSEIHSKVTSIDLVCPGTIDEECLEALDRKENVADTILKFKL